MPTAKNFLLFTYSFEYPRGGMRDFQSAHPSLKQAQRAAAAWEDGKEETSWHILHLTSRRVYWPDGGYSPLKSLKTGRRISM